MRVPNDKVVQVVCTLSWPSADRELSAAAGDGKSLSFLLLRSKSLVQVNLSYPACHQGHRVHCSLVYKTQHLLHAETLDLSMFLRSAQTNGLLKLQHACSDCHAITLSIGAALALLMLHGRGEWEGNLH